MEGKKSFKERVKDTIVENAVAYNAYYVPYEYLLYSKSFKQKPYYIISAHEDNYLHLTGVHTTLSAKAFFDKCLDGTLDESDFDFTKDGQEEKAVKGSVRRKINSLPAMMGIFNGSTMVEEDFSKNRIRCAFAAADSAVTVGFVVTGKARPMTLLKGNELNLSKAACLDLVLRRKKGEDKFSEVVIGTPDILNQYRADLNHLLSVDI